MTFTKQVAQELVTMAAVVGATVLLMSTCAKANDAKIDLPPAKYDRQYGPGIDVYTSGPFFDEGSGYRKYKPGDDPKHAFWGITVPPKKGKRCEVFVSPVGSVIADQELDEVGFINLVLHERAHCNGWSHKGHD